MYVWCEREQTTDGLREVAEGEEEEVEEEAGRWDSWSRLPLGTTCIALRGGCRNSPDLSDSVVSS